jgi:hypothetical protein
MHGPGPALLLMIPSIPMARIEQGCERAPTPGATMKPATGQILRGVGLAIETVCLLAYVIFQYEGVFEWDVRPVLMAGVGVGIAVWVAGIAIIRASSPRSRDPD